MKYSLTILLLISLAACNNADKIAEPVSTDSAVTKPAADSTANYIYTFSDTALGKKITDTLLKLPFVIKSNNYIDSFSNHKHSLAFMLTKPAAGESDISVQAGYNGDQRFETYYRFSVNPQTLDIKVYDAVSEKKLTVKEYLKSQK